MTKLVDEMNARLDRIARERKHLEGKYAAQMAADKRKAQHAQEEFRNRARLWAMMGQSNAANSATNLGWLGAAYSQSGYPNWYQVSQGDTCLQPDARVFGVW